MNPASVFDRVASTYDQAWTFASTGRLQREAFWNIAAPYLRSGDSVLDIGCGTGEDAVRLMRSGARVTAIDISPNMVAIARSRGVDARVLAVEELARISQPFDVVISNFGALNCVASLSTIREALANSVKPGGFALLCLLSRFCLWETVWFLAKLDARNAARRWRGETTTTGGLHVRYFGVRSIVRALSPEFTLVERAGVGCAVPPSFVHGVPDGVLHLAARFDRRVCRIGGFRSIADHTLLIFRRN